MVNMEGDAFYTFVLEGYVASTVLIYKTRYGEVSPLSPSSLPDDKLDLHIYVIVFLQLYHLSRLVHFSLGYDLKIYLWQNYSNSPSKQLLLIKMLRSSSWKKRANIIKTYCIVLVTLDNTR